MAVSDEFLDYVIDQLAGWGEVSARRMFGGAGHYCDSVMFGLIADDVAYLKVDDSNREDFVKAGSSAFNPYPEKDKSVVMSYYEIPADVLEDAELLCKWAANSYSGGNYFPCACERVSLEYAKKLHRQSNCILQGLTGLIYGRDAYKIAGRQAAGQACGPCYID
jgi:DNA transformation protein